MPIGGQISVSEKWKKPQNNDLNTINSIIKNIMKAVLNLSLIIDVVVHSV